MKSSAKRARKARQALPNLAESSKSGVFEIPETGRVVRRGSTAVVEEAPAVRRGSSGPSSGADPK